MGLESDSGNLPKGEVHADDNRRLDHAQTSVDAPMHGLGVAPERATVAGRHIGERKLK